MKTFELNGKSYTTDQETLKVLNSVRGSNEAAIAVIVLGEATGRIKSVPPSKDS